MTNTASRPDPLGSASENDNTCADCFYPLDEHCEDCGECDCENSECMDDSEAEDEES